MESMQKTRLPVVAACRDSTSFRMIQRKSPTLIQMLDQFQYVMGEPTLNYDFSTQDEKYYNVSFVPKELINTKTPTRAHRQIHNLICFANVLDDKGYYKQADNITNKISKMLTKGIHP